MTEIRIESVTDAVMAHEGIRASINAGQAVMGEDLTAAVERIIPLAAAVVATKTGTEMTLRNGTIRFEKDMNGLAMEAAIVWMTLAMISDGKTQAQSYKDAAESAIAETSRSASGECPGRRQCRWW